MKSAIVTGSSSGIGLEISKTLLELGYKVYGISRTDFKIESENYFHIVCDISDSKRLKKMISEIEKKDDSIYILINNAGIGYFGMHEELNIDRLEKMLLTNFVSPILITRLLLRQIKKNKGYIFNILSITAKKDSPFGCAYSATKSGLSKFGNNLFEEIRKSGAKVINIYPDITKTNFYKDSNFQEDEDPSSYIEPNTIGEIVKNILSMNPNMIISEITVRPQLHKIKKKINLIK